MHKDVQRCIKMFKMYKVNNAHLQYREVVKEIEDV
jgi:hypothetical protein